MTRLAVVHNNVDEASSIGQLAAWSVRTALDEGWEVTVVARDLEPALRSSVTWLPLYVPPRLHALQWALARKTVQHALRGHVADVLHVYQPQIARLADTWHVCYLSRVGVETQSLHAGNAVRDRVNRTQQTAVAWMEDGYLRRMGQRASVLFCSELLGSHFSRLYGTPAHAAILHNPAFSVAKPAAGDREQARAAFDIRPGTFVVGYLGGRDERKGYRELLQAVSILPDDTVLLAAGPGSESIADSRLGSRLRLLGHLQDLGQFWQAVDVLAVPSRFDPFAMVVTEAASHGVPVVVTPMVGSGSLVSRYGAGEVCSPEEFSAGLSHVRATGRERYGPGSRRLSEAMSATVLGSELVGHWLTAAERRRKGS